MGHKILLQFYSHKSPLCWCRTLQYSTQHTPSAFPIPLRDMCFSHSSLSCGRAKSVAMKMILLSIIEQQWSALSISRSCSQWRTPTRRKYRASHVKAQKHIEGLWLLVTAGYYSGITLLLVYTTCQCHQGIEFLSVYYHSTYRPHHRYDLHTPRETIEERWRREKVPSERSQLQYNFDSSQTQQWRDAMRNKK